MNMKKAVWAIATCIFITGVFLTSSNTPSRKFDNPQSNIIKANKGIDNDDKEYLADIANYRKDVASKFAANCQSVMEFQARIEHDRKAAKAEYKTKIAELAQKNNNMNKKMENYKEEGKEKWEIFKAQFSLDMNELGKAFKDLTP
jgi:hypothetical protein